jgi:hypothetical protein
MHVGQQQRWRDIRAKGVHATVLSKGRYCAGGCKAVQRVEELLQKLK